MRRLAIFLALLLTPVLVISTPNVARAATNIGNTADASFATEWHSMFRTSCGVSAYFERVDDLVPSIIGSIACEMGYMIEQVSVELTFQGETCSFETESGMMTDLQGSDGATAFEAFYPVQGPGVDVPADCAVNELCWVVHADKEWDSDAGTGEYDGSGCTAVALGAPPLPLETDTTCPIFDVDSLGWSAILDWVQTDGPPLTNFDQWSVFMNAPITWKTLPAGVTENDIYFSLVYKDKRAGQTPPVGTNPFWYGHPGGESVGVRLARNVSTFVSSPYGAQSYGAPDSAYEIVGMAVRFRGTFTGSETFTQSLPQNLAAGDVGLTKPSKCMFYVGEKIAETADNTDIPMGPLNTDPPITEPPVLDPVPPTDPDSDNCSGFSFTDPTTWAGQAFCQIVAVLVQIWESIKGMWGSLKSILAKLTTLAADIVSGILDAFEEWFVPDVDSWDLDGLMDQIEARPPFSIIAGLGTAASSMASAFSASGSCGSLTNFTSDDISADVSCSAVQSVPGWSALYGLVGLAMMALTGIGLWNMFQNTIERGQ